MRKAGHLWVMAFLFVVFFVSGCAATKKIKDDIMGGNAILKKKIAFFTGQNLSGQGGQNLGPFVSNTLKMYMQTDEGVIIVSSEEIRQALNRVPVLASGHRENLALAQVGRVYGLNAVLDTTLQDIWFTWEKRGIWGFREQVPFMKVALSVKVYDIETTATLVNEVFLEEVGLSGDLYDEGTDMTRYSEDLVKAALTGLMPRVVEHVRERLAEVSWKGFVVSKEGSYYIISAGQDVGLKAGDVLEVLEMGEPIEGVGGEVFLVPGGNMGRLRVAEARPSKALAEPLSGDGDFEKSCAVMRRE